MIAEKEVKQKTKVFNKIDNIIVVNNKVLIEPHSEEITESGIILPKEVQDRKDIKKGYIIKLGKGYPIPTEVDTSEAWKAQRGGLIDYMPLDAEEGDLAYYHIEDAIEIEFDRIDYQMIKFENILFLYRDNDK